MSRKPVICPTAASFSPHDSLSGSIASYNLSLVSPHRLAAFCNMHMTPIACACWVYILSCERQDKKNMLVPSKPLAEPAPSSGASANPERSAQKASLASRSNRHPTDQSAGCPLHPISNTRAARPIRPSPIRCRPPPADTLLERLFQHAVSLHLSRPESAPQRLVYHEFPRSSTL